MAAEIMFDTDGEEFRDNGMSEVFKVLREIQENLMRGEESGKIYDDDGNVIGRWTVRLPLD